jgi:predicted RNase H-like HicB family nuclease
MTRYLVVVERTGSGFSAFSPDLPGCVSTGRTREAVEANMREAIGFHIEGLRQEGYAVPEPSSESTYIEVADSFAAAVEPARVSMHNSDVRWEIEAGLADSAAGRTVPVGEVRRRFGLPEQPYDERWLPTATDVTLTDESLTVELSDGRTLSVPLAWYPRLTQATQEERDRWRLVGGGEGIHWTDLDEDISVEDLLAGRPSGESQRSLQRWLEHRRDSAS